MSNNFRAVALALRDYITNTYDLLAAADAVLSLVPECDRDHVVPGVTSVPHATLVFASIGNPTIMGYLRESRKINAIKELRTISGCGLKAAKEAVEDQRVSDAVAAAALDDLRARLTFEDPPGF